MALAIPQVDLQPGHMICLHLPHGYNDEFAVVTEEIIRRATVAGKSAMICRPAQGRTGFREFFRKLRSAEWLSRAAGISKADAAQVIATSPIPVWEILGHNAGNPRCFLGIAAAICRKPAVIVYSTCGLDPLGRKAIHQYVESRSRDFCAVHLSPATIHDDETPLPRMCPSSARCVELRPV